MEDSRPEAGAQRREMAELPRIKPLGGSLLGTGEIATSQASESAPTRLFADSNQRMAQVEQNLGRTANRQIETGRTSETLGAALSSAVARMEQMQTTQDYRRIGHEMAMATQNQAHQALCQDGNCNTGTEERRPHNPSTTESV